MPLFRSLIASNLFNNNFNGIYKHSGTRQLKTALKIQWFRPVKKPMFHPSNSGDNTSLTKYGANTTIFGFENSKELETADENVKKIFQLNLSSGNAKLQLYRQELADLVRRHEFDFHSREVMIANATAKIRYLQEHMINYPRDVKKKVMLQHTVDRRKRYLTQLRRWDYRRFEWILEKLDLFYRPYPRLYDRVERKKSMKQLTTIHCLELKEKKIAEYRKKMNSEKVPFIERKLAKLQWIREQEELYDLEPSVTDEDIEQCQKQLEAIQLEVETLKDKNYERKVHPYTLEIYDEEALELAENMKS